MSKVNLTDLVYLPRPRRISDHTRPVTEPQGYRLRITPAGTEIEAPDAAGRFYAEMTLRQIRRQCGDELTAAVAGFHVSNSRRSRIPAGREE